VELLRNGERHDRAVADQSGQIRRGPSLAGRAFRQVISSLNQRRPIRRSDVMTEAGQWPRRRHDSKGPSVRNLGSPSSRGAAQPAHVCFTP
jgi:hypothetical protein